MLRRRSAAACLLRLWVRILNAHRLAPVVPFSVVVATKHWAVLWILADLVSLSDAEKESPVPAGLHRLLAQVVVEVV
jgi:hypothetical protein